MEQGFQVRAVIYPAGQKTLLDCSTWAGLDGMVRFRLWSWVKWIIYLSKSKKYEEIVCVYGCPFFYRCLFELLLLVFTVALLGPDRQICCQFGKKTKPKRQLNQLGAAVQPQPHVKRIRMHSHCT